MCGLFLSREVGPCSDMLLTCLTLSLHHLSNSVCICLADVHSQPGELPLQDRFLFSLYGFFFSGSLLVLSGCISTAVPSLFSATADKRNVNKTFSLFVWLFLFFHVSSYKGSPLIFFFYPCVPKYTLILDFKTLPGRERGCYSQTLSLTEVFTMMCVD